MVSGNHDWISTMKKQLREELAQLQYFQVKIAPYEKYLGLSVSGTVSIYSNSEKNVHDQGLIPCWIC